MMKIGSDPREWSENYDEVLAYADFMVSTGRLITAANALYYFQKPWKWTDQHAAWVSQGRPEDM